ncbi:LysR family transcriptional regulator [Bacillus sp. 1NLA3E]|uniref:LysR family transcriptional regulator n=1 Tax=Bacillus sp. 1NLA3E TaxID=666686 RepID=UPI000247E342|nr:LysR family transcriptional regulator [Bacillus sp. 1NLA3E]AGK54801.1 HTH-type transcriptional regulator yxjO [Bacillus sp. 1NLA3E]
MDIKWLKTFIVAAKYENFRQASEELFLTQPAITKHIKRLEENLNIPLFNRMGKNVSLSPAGHKFLPFALEMIDQYDKRLEEFEAWKQGYNRKLMIATAPQIASSILPSILRKFIDENPDIEVIINVVKSYDIGEEISSGKADLGLTRIQPVQTNVNTEMVHKEPVILVGPIDKQKGASLAEEQVLQKYRLLTHNHPEYWDDLLNDIKRHYPIIRTMTVNQVEITKRFIEEGLGVSFLPLTMVKEEINNNKMVQISPDKISLPTSSTYVVTKVETNEVVAFIKFFKDELESMCM